jgi:uncharacterized membrane protein YsdA (DUF1294 family)
MFGLDKSQAKRNAWRISESVLLVLAFLGPFGAFLTMQLFRHKTRKPKFWLVPIFLVIHSTLLVYLFVTLPL